MRNKSDRSDTDRLTSLLLAVRDHQDPQAFDQIYDHYTVRVRAFLAKAGPSWLDPDGLAQEVMTTVWRRASLFDPARSSATTWVFAIARNRRVDAIRRRHLQLIETDKALVELDDWVITEKAILREQRLKDALARLSANHRMMIELLFFRGMSHSEASKATGLALGTVKTRSRSALQALRGLLKVVDER